MKQVVIKSTVDMLQKIETIEKEVMDLKVSVLKKLAPTGKKGHLAKGYPERCGYYRRRYHLCKEVSI